MDKGDRLQQEALVDQYVERGDKDLAVKLLYELISAYAKEKDFKKAESLHNRMYEIDPLALTELVRAGELIEAEKSEVLEPQYLELWPDLFDLLSTEEANSLYFSMKSAVFETGDTIMAQGRMNSRLYFILSGEINLLYKKGDSEEYLNSLGPGDILGWESFFSPTVCTLSASAMARAKAGFIENSALKQWKTDAPALDSKLFDYCRKKDRIRGQLAKGEMERRSDRRLNLSGRLSFQLLDKSGRRMAKAYKGEIADISKGGISFIVKSFWKNFSHKDILE